MPARLGQRGSMRVHRSLHCLVAATQVASRPTDSVTACCRAASERSCSFLIRQILSTRAEGTLMAHWRRRGNAGHMLMLCASLSSPTNRCSTGTPGARRVLTGGPALPAITRVLPMPSSGCHSPSTQSGMARFTARRSRSARSIRLRSASRHTESALQHSQLCFISMALRSRGPRLRRASQQQGVRGCAGVNGPSAYPKRLTDHKMAVTIA